MQTLTVSLDERSYPIHIGENLLDRADLLLPLVRSRQVCIITNTTVAPLYLQRVLDLLAPCAPDHLILPDGEQHKTLDTVSQIYDHLLARNYSRSSVLVALGGGVIGDMVGFAAATYQRGVRFIQIPTTLLAQVDSSVGGKTGVNRPLGKNMVGAFYQPQAVLIDVNTLDTLPPRELRAGLAEVIKYGVINNREFYDWLHQALPALLARDRQALIHAIKVSCEEKAAIVAADETEGGVRAILNLGHTFGHAIETAMGYGEWLHGEAVATGMVMAADLSQRMGLLGADDAAAIRQLLERAELPVVPPAIAPDRFLALMAKDKKAEQGAIKFILLEAIGKAVFNRSAPADALSATLQAGSRLAQA
ncbi:MAG TPA: 3-dehydroquinate synthase [Hyphomicrobiales bacterium]|nr:3-dehydroquinate synthase [Hyphomicrobiales bacterium]